MKFTETKLPGVVIVEPKVFGDRRGFFMESWSKRAFEEAGLFYDFVQDNHSSSAVRGTLRGIHFQRGDKAQAKLVRCARGAVLDEEALVDALREKRIAGAAFDVYASEPIARNHPYVTELPNVVITPHIAGATSAVLTNHTRQIVADVDRFFHGKQLLYQYHN